MLACAVSTVALLLSTLACATCTAASALATFARAWTLGFEGAGIDLRDDFAFCHRRIIVDQQLLNGAGDLGAYLHRGDGVQRTAGVDSGGDAAPLDAGGQIIGRQLLAVIVNISCCGRGPE